MYGLEMGIDAVSAIHVGSLGSFSIREPLPITPFIVGSGSGWIVVFWIVSDRSGV
jgi:hypothetical protein